LSGPRHGSRGGRLLAALALAGCVLAAAPARHRRPPAAAGPRAAVAARPKAAAAGAIANPAALGPFLDKLRELEQPGADRVVRVLQFGDSHTAADYFSGRIRRRLQARFGDAGPGYLLSARPWRGYPHEGVRLAAGAGWTAQSLRNDASGGLVGLTGASLVCAEAGAAGPALTVRAAFGSFRVELLGPEGASLQATLAPEGAAAEAPATEVPPAGAQAIRPGLSLQRFALAGPASPGPCELSLFPSPESRLLGVDLLSGRPGVVYDELGLNGAELLDLERWDPALRRALLAGIQPDLIVLAYGTNDEGMGVEARDGFPARAVELLRALKEASGAPVLVIGPLDRVGRKRRQRGPLKEGADWIIQALKQASLQCDCAFWDARRAMGGYGAITRWRRAGLAQKDLVHLTGPGYQRLGDQFADALLAGLGRGAGANPPTTVRLPPAP